MMKHKIIGLNLLMILVVGSIIITLFIISIFTLIHQKSTIDKGFSNGSRSHPPLQYNNTATAARSGSKGGRNNTIIITDDKFIDKKMDQNAIMPGIFPEQSPQTQTVSDIIGPKNHSVEENKKNPSQLSTSSFANDQFQFQYLDGLIAPSSKFDEASSCLSRYQSHHLHRKTSSPYSPPSAYLISTLRNYERLHKSCGPHTKSYNKIMMRKGTKFSRKDTGGTTTNTKCKYLVWTASNGLGNRMLTLASAFLYAILTDRVLLVRFGTDMFHLFCQPFPYSSWLLPNNWKYQNNNKNTTSISQLLLIRLNLQHSLLKKKIPQNTHTHHHSYFFHCDQTQLLLHKVPILILRSDQYFIPSLFMVQSFRQVLHKMFPEKDTVFHHLGRYLFQPSNKAWEVIRKLYDEAHLAEANERIGLQIRVYNNNTTHKETHQTIINEIIACAVQHKLLPEEMDVKKTGRGRKKQISKAVVVASLHPEYGEKLRAMYDNDKEVIKVYQASEEGRQRSNNETHNMKAWSEIYLLSLCDVLITSSKSTFGYVAQSLGGLKPWILQRAYGEIITPNPNPPCQRAISMEPCFHYPPKYECSSSTSSYKANNNNNIVDFTSLFPHMKHCEDVTGGLRLIN